MKVALLPTNPFTFVLRDESVDGRYLPLNANWNVASSNWLCFFVSYVGSPSDMMDPCLLSELELQGWSLSMSFSNGDPQWGLSHACFLYGLHLSKLELPSNAHDKCLNRRSYSWWHLLAWFLQSSIESYSLCTYVTLANCIMWFSKLGLVTNWFGF